MSEQCHLPAFSTHSQEEAEGGGGWAVIYSTVKVGPPDVVSCCVNKYTTHSTAYINTTCCWRLLSLSVLCCHHHCQSRTQLSPSLSESDTAVTIIVRVRHGCHHHCQSRTQLCYGQSTHSSVLMALVSALLAFVLNFKYWTRWIVLNRPQPTRTGP